MAAVPAVYIRAAVSPTILPTAKIIHASIPGTAEGRTILNTVLSFPAPSPKLPSLKEFGTDFRASSVVLIISGRIIIARVKAPAIMENPQPNVSTKKSSPNRPYTIDGIPDRVSVVSLISPNSLLPLLAYSTRNIAANIVIEMGYATDLHRGALIGTGLVLFVFILIINASVSLLNRRSSNE